jgi:hypothetical protein
VRIGHNPARFVEKVDQPANITVTVVNCIPFLSGYYEQSLDVLKVVIESLNATREAAHPYDVMLFDNHSCAEVRDYLKEANDQGKIQYLVLSDTNIGKIGAWNYMFGAAQGEYIVFSDGDVGFRPGWLSASLEIFEAFPNTGMVTARPLPTPEKYSQATLDWARRENVLEKGPFLDYAVAKEHADSLSRKGPSRPPGEPINMSRVTWSGKSAYVGAAHFQFMARREVLQKLVPLESRQPMRGERALDISIDQMGFLRLLTEQPLVWHIGNHLPSMTQLSASPVHKSLLKRILWLPGIRHVLLWLHNQLFRLYFFNVE